MSSVPSPAEIAADATWLAQALDSRAGLVRLVRMGAEDYRAAAFLDDRLLGAGLEAHLVPWPGVRAAATVSARRDARWIFHIGHVGSTLVARLLGELDGVLAVREPRLLRDLLAMPPDDRLVAAPLLSRTFAHDEVALVKATSFVSEIAAGVVPPRGRAMLLYASPRAYIEGILAGENSVVELRMLAQSRTQRMAGRVAAPAARTDADLAALAWACEMTALEAAAEAIGTVHWADFDRMLEDMDVAMLQAAQALDLPATAERVRAINAGPLLGRYSKDTAYEYSPGLRRELLGEARLLHGPDIDSAIRLLHNAARSSPLLERALSRASTEA